MGECYIMNVMELLETNNYEYRNLSSLILSLEFDGHVKVEHYGTGKFDLFDGVRLVCEDCEVILNFEEDSEFARMGIFYYDDGGFCEFGFDDDGVCLYVNDDGYVVSF